MLAALDARAASKQAVVLPNALFPRYRRRLSIPKLNGCGSTPIVPSWGRCTTHFRTYFSGWDVHWGYGVLPHGQMDISQN